MLAVQRNVLGLDIGGANLKAAHTQGIAWTRPFALWKQPQQLAAELSRLVAEAPPFELLAVTMTAELCDCYATKREGVNAVLDAVQAAAGTTPVRVWQNDGELVSVTAARREPLKAAAANWLALATFAGRYCPRGSGLLIDIGSTTTDLIPLMDGVPVPAGRTDLERLAAHELVYTGVSRTPLCALLPEVIWRNRSFRPAAEWFATTQDVYLLLGNVPEDPDNCDTADGRPATRVCAHARLARMLCADTETFSEEDAMNLARDVAWAQSKILRRSFSYVLGPAETVILSGIGEFLAPLALGPVKCYPTISLTQKLGGEISRAACAYALAVLAAERS